MFDFLGDLNGEQNSYTTLPLDLCAQLVAINASILACTFIMNYHRHLQGRHIAAIHKLRAHVGTSLMKGHISPFTAVLNLSENIIM